MSASPASHVPTGRNRSWHWPTSPCGPAGGSSTCARAAGQGYAGQGLALADVLAHLYFRVMRRRPDGSYLDRFVLSTGHSAIALFAILGEVGAVRTGRTAHLRPARLPDRGKPAGRDARLRDHRRLARPGPVAGGRHGAWASGCAARAPASTAWSPTESCRRARSGRRPCRPATSGSDNLTVLVDNNHMQADGATADVMGVEPVVERFSAFGFDAERVDAHDHAELEKALPRRPCPPGPAHGPSCWRRSRARASPRSSATTRCITSGSERAPGIDAMAELGCSRRATLHHRGAAMKSGTRTLAGNPARPRSGRARSRLWWLYQAGLAVKTPGGTIVVVDPYLSDAVLRTYQLPRNVPAPLDPGEVDADALLATHSHADHLDPDSIAPFMSHDRHPVHRAADGRGKCARQRA